MKISLHEFLSYYEICEVIENLEEEQFITLKTYILIKLEFKSHKNSNVSYCQ